MIMTSFFFSKSCTNLWKSFTKSCTVPFADSHCIFQRTAHPSTMVMSGVFPLVGERSHMTSAAEGGGGFEMLTVADKGGEGV